MSENIVLVFTQDQPSIDQEERFESIFMEEFKDLENKEKMLPLAKQMISLCNCEDLDLDNYHSVIRDEDTSELGN